MKLLYNGIANLVNNVEDDTESFKNILLSSEKKSKVYIPSDDIFIGEDGCEYVVVFDSDDDIDAWDVSSQIMAEKVKNYLDNSDHSDLSDHLAYIAECVRKELDGAKKQRIAEITKDMQVVFDLTKLYLVRHKTHSEEQADDVLMITSNFKLAQKYAKNYDFIFAHCKNEFYCQNLGELIKTKD